MSVSIQQAANNAFAAWLSGQLPGVNIEPRWPAADRLKQAQTITIAIAGARQDIPIDPKILKMTNVGSNQVTAQWMIAACTQPVQMDIWTVSDPARDDLVAQLDTILHSDNSTFVSSGVGFGTPIAVANGWEVFGTIADFNFDQPEYEMSSDDMSRSLFRAIYRGEAYFMLALSKTTARQTVINFQQRISESFDTMDSL